MNRIRKRFENIETKDSQKNSQ